MREREREAERREKRQEPKSNSKIGLSLRPLAALLRKISSKEQAGQRTLTYPFCYSRILLHRHNRLGRLVSVQRVPPKKQLAATALPASGQIATFSFPPQRRQEGTDGQRSAHLVSIGAFSQLTMLATAKLTLLLLLLLLLLPVCGLLLLCSHASQSVMDRRQPC